ERFLDLVADSVHWVEGVHRPLENHRDLRPSHRLHSIPLGPLDRAAGEAAVPGALAPVDEVKKVSFQGVGVGLTVRDHRLGVLDRSEEHTSELQSRGHLVCRLLLEKKKTTKIL